MAMLPKYEKGSLRFSLKFNPDVFSVSIQLDIALLLNVIAGFSLKDLDDIESTS